MSSAEPIAIEIRRGELPSAVVDALISTLNAELTAIYPEAGATHFRLDPSEVAEGKGAFLVAYAGGKPIGCGALRKLDAESAEVKRMYVAAEARGRGVGGAILSELEKQGRRLGVRRIVLETGVRQHAALALYARVGFVRVPAWGEYVGSPLSVSMAKTLAG